MTTVRTRLRAGFVEITAPGLTAVAEVGDRHVEALENAASEGLVHLLDLLCSRGLLVLPAFGIVTTDGEGVRVLLRGAVELELGDGRTVTSEHREPWREADVGAGDHDLVLVTPEPRPARGWRRPARLAGGAGQAAPSGGHPQSAGSDPVPDSPSREAEPRADRPEESAPRADRTEESAPRADRSEEAEQAAPALPPADLTLPPPEDGAGSAPADRVPPSSPPATGIIDSVPWRRPGGGSPPGSEGGPRTERFDAPPAAAARESALSTHSTSDPDPVPADPAAPVEESYPAPEAAPRPDADVPPAEVTTARGSLPRSDEDLDRPVVLAVLCPAGHHSAPHAGRCRTCGREIPPQQPAPIPRPSLGVLRISTGGVVPLDRGVLLGRAPRVNEELPPDQRPHLIRVGGVDRDISRNHAEVVLEGWHVLVRDLGSTNGTTVALPGEEPVRLRPTEDQGIEPGTVITLADEVTLTYEVDG